MKQVTVRRRKASKPELSADACIGCHREPAHKGSLGKNCKQWRYSHSLQSDSEYAGYLNRLDVANERVGRLGGRLGKTVVSHRRRA